MSRGKGSTKEKDSLHLVFSESLVFLVPPRHKRLGVRLADLGAEGDGGGKDVRLLRREMASSSSPCPFLTHPPAALLAHTGSNKWIHQHCLPSASTGQIDSRPSYSNTPTRLPKTVPPKSRPFSLATSSFRALDQINGRARDQHVNICSHLESSFIPSWSDLLTRLEFPRLASRLSFEFSFTLPSSSPVLDRSPVGRCQHHLSGKFSGSGKGGDLEVQKEAIYVCEF